MSCLLTCLLTYVLVLRKPNTSLIYINVFTNYFYNLLNYMQYKKAVYKNKQKRYLLVLYQAIVLL